MMYRAEEAIGIWWKIHSSCLCLQIQDGTDEGRILMGEAVVLLTRPSRSLNIVKTRKMSSPGNFAGNLVELGVLHHHGVDDAQE